MVRHGFRHDCISAGKSLDIGLRLGRYQASVEVAARLRLP
jgi:hypothetical protein